MLDSKLNFNHHVSALCTKAARQLNALARISRFLSTSSRMIIYNSFINSNFNYCPIVWHFCGKKNGDKIEKNQERALRIIYRNYDSLYPELLRDAGAYTMLDKRLRSMLLHVFKSLKGMNAKCLNDMYSAKQLNYSMRRCVKLVQPQRKTTTAGLKTVSYLGAKLWNDNAVLCNEFWNEDFLTFKRTVNDPNLDIITHDDFQYLWNLTSAPLMHVSFLAFLLFLPSLAEYKFQYLFSVNELWRIIWDNFQRLFIEFRIYSKLVANILMIFLCFVYICKYIFALYILFAPWSYTSHRLMFFVVNTTENKAYLILS